MLVVVAEPAPSTTSPCFAALALVPIATASSADTFTLLPNATARLAVAVICEPIAVKSSVWLLPVPNVIFVPKATELCPLLSFDLMP